VPAREAHRCDGAGSSGSPRRRFPQALGASPPGRDADAAGPQQWRTLARQAARRGKRVAVQAGGVRAAPTAIPTRPARQPRRSAPEHGVALGGAAWTGAAG